MRGTVSKTASSVTIRSPTQRPRRYAVTIVKLRRYLAKEEAKLAQVQAELEETQTLIAAFRLVIEYLGEKDDQVPRNVTGSHTSEQFLDE